MELPRVKKIDRPLLTAALLGGLLVASPGCQGLRSGLRRPPGPPAPVVLQTTPTAEQIVSAVNQNTNRVQTYSTNNARFTVPGLAGLPILRGNIAMERPMRFRLAAGSVVTGPEIDLGSNDELLWFWVKRNSPPALYYSRHDQYASSGARQMLPVDPTWIGDALGLVQLDPAAQYEGPFPRADGTLELRSHITTPTGPMTRVVVVDPTRAWVLEQHLYDRSSGGAGGAPVASALAEDFRYDTASMVSLPRRVTIRLPASDLALTINVGKVTVNGPMGDPAQLWTPPAIAQRVDLGSTTPGMPIQLPPTEVSPIEFSADASAKRALPSIASVVGAPIEPVAYGNRPAAPPVLNQLPRGGIALEPVGWPTSRKGR